MVFFIINLRCGIVGCSAYEENCHTHTQICECLRLWWLKKLFIIIIIIIIIIILFYFNVHTFNVIGCIKLKNIFTILGVTIDGV
jgi:hypothetical protein